MYFLLTKPIKKKKKKTKPIDRGMKSPFSHNL
jgi:hypothetical protein